MQEEGTDGGENFYDIDYASTEFVLNPKTGIFYVAHDILLTEENNKNTQNNLEEKSAREPTKNELIEFGVEVRGARMDEWSTWLETNSVEWMYDSEDPMQASRAMDSRWLIRWKWNLEKQIWKIRARLVVKGVQDDRVLETTYSPTASRMAQRIILMHAARGRKRGRRVASIDITKAFLQGDMYETEDMVLLTPPPDLRRARHVLKCRKSVYGLKDAPRKWYLALRTFLLSLGGRGLAWRQEKGVSPSSVTLTSSISTAGTSTTSTRTRRRTTATSGLRKQGRTRA